MKYALVFGVLALALGWNAGQCAFLPLKIALISGALCFAGVALAYAGAGPRLFLKRRDGRLSPLGWALFWPFHALNFASLRLFRWRQQRRGTLISGITEAVFLGPRLSAAQAETLAARGVTSILDVAGELPENSVFRRAPFYRSLPALDALAPHLDDLRSGADWIDIRRRSGPVYVHCALGHGRSATFVAAFLMRSGRASSPETAVAMIRQKRPGIELSAVQMRVLERFARDLAARQGE